MDISRAALECIHRQWVGTLDAIRDPILVLDPGARVIRMNRAMADLVAAPIREVLGQSITTLLPWLPHAYTSPAADGGNHGQVTAPSGQVFAHRSYPVPTAGEHSVHILEDVTAQVRLAAVAAAAHERTLAALVGAIQAVAMALYQKDPYSAAHGERVARLAHLIAGELGLPESDRQGVHLGATVHDIGKLYVPSAILYRPGRLPPAEMALVRTHPAVGLRILEGLEFPWPVQAIVGSHHERLDGSGYPDGLHAEQLSVAVRIVAVADVLEAMASHRPYRPGLGVAKALAELTSGSGTLYDADAVAAAVALAHGGRVEFLEEDSMSGIETLPRRVG